MVATHTKREKAEPNDDRGPGGQRSLHMFGDVGPPIEAPDWRPRICGNPEERLAAAFLAMGRDYGGPLSADIVVHAVFKELHAVLTAPAAHSGIEATAEVEGVLSPSN
ncbi:hypothetical protein [Bradyrhizobium sp. B120]|uniref:hypothetical protein n=1 Tax=Bradyrhizobium sp. B120 TaxID=3410088 RepID=UPI003B97F991